MITLRPYQQAFIDGAKARYAAGDRRVAGVMATGGGKGHPLHTEVPTPDGLRKWGDLVPGDLVFGRDGVPTAVLAVYDRGVLPTYRVTFSDGASVLVDGDHVWAVRDRSRDPYGTITTAELAGQPLRKARGYRWRIPLTFGPYRRQADLPLAPYVVGALIANGGMTSNSTTLTTPDPEVAAVVARATECRKIADTTSDMCDRYSLPGLVPVTKALGLRVHSHEKHIPRAYLEGAHQQRLALLHGLMDGDGSMRDRARRSVAYSTTSPQLASDLVELVSSLGGTATVRCSEREGKRAEYVLGVMMSADRSPFLLGRKAQAGTASIRELQPRRAIVRVEYAGDQRIRCIRVDAADQLYLITRAHIVTHNTPTFATLVREAVHAGKPALVLAHRTELIDQAIDKLVMVAPDLRVGRFQGSVKQWRAQVVVGSIQTVSTDAGLRLLGASGFGFIVVDECFPAGTLIDGKPIETLRTGDVVRSYDEASGEVVDRPMVGPVARKPIGMVRVYLDDGTSFACTPNHPIMTRNGWCPAFLLDSERLSGGAVLSFTHDEAARGELYGVRQAGDAYGQRQDRQLPQVGPNVLHERVQGCMGEPGQLDSDGPDQSQARVGQDAPQQPDGSRGSASQDGRDGQADRPQAAGAWREWKTSPGSASEVSGASGLAHRGYRRAGRWGAPVSLQDRHSASDNDGVRRGGRQLARHSNAPRIGLASRRPARFIGVDHVEILEPGSDGTYGGVCPDGLVYNFEVEGTHTYLVGEAGIVAHNCHHTAAPTYVRTLKALGAYEPNGPLVLGVTATLGRADGLALGDIFESVLEPRIGLIDLVRQGFLVPPRGIRVKIAGLDMSSVRTVAGDLNSGQVAQAMHDALAPAAIARGYLEHAAGRQTIAFLPSVTLSVEQAEAFREHGVDAVHIDGTTPADERALVLKRYRAGEITVLCNCALFTEGTDLPSTSCIILGRPTKSPELYQQMVGRGLRLAPGKTDCVVLDVTGVTGRHKLATIASLNGDARAEDDVETVPDDLLMYEDELAEPVADNSQPAEPEQSHGADGPLDHELVDLFERQNAAWQRTPGGTWFLVTPVAFLHLTPEIDGNYSLGWTSRTGHRNANGQRSGLLHEDPLEVGYAMAWGEDYARSVPQWGLERDAEWRTRPARSGRERATGARSRGEAADIIAMREASCLLDGTP